LGNGAHSYAYPVRRWNVRDWEAYRSRVVAGRSAEDDRETVDAEAHLLECVWLGLRTRAGVPRPEVGTTAEVVTRRWEREQLATEHEGRIRLTVEGWLLLDQLTIELAGCL
jgi:coproporphyrinogen III oxidase-like Fe-S oxidoreductase